MIITIDGPAGGGKSSVAKKIAQILNMNFFDTGAMYRSITWYFIDNDIDINDEVKIKESLSSFNFDIQTMENNERRYFVNKKDVTDLIRMHEVTNKVSEVSAIEAIRKHLVKIQRKFGKKSDTIFEGRDMGTVVFPFADLKFYITASPKVRAERRFLQLMEKFPEIASSHSYEKILSEINERDRIDSTRKISPLKMAEDAILIDSSNLSFERVIEIMVKKIRKYKKRRLCPRPQFLKMHFFYSLVLFLSWVYFKIFYRLKVHGISHFINGPAIIASNHVSFYDPPLLAVSALEEVHFLARESLFKNFLFKKLIKKLNSHPLSGDGSDAKSFKRIIHLLSKGKKVIMFPEGIRSYDGEIGKIKPGMGFLVYLSQCMVFPTYIHGAYDVWKRTKKFPRLWGKIHVVFGSPINPVDFEGLDKKKFMSKVDSKIEKSLSELKDWCDSGFQGTPP